MLTLWNTKILLLIAALLMTVVGLLIHQKELSDRAEQRQAAVEARERQQLEEMKRAEKIPHDLGGMEQGMKKRKIY